MCPAHSRQQPDWGQVATTSTPDYAHVIHKHRRNHPLHQTKSAHFRVTPGGRSVVSRKLRVIRLCDASRPSGVGVSLIRSLPMRYRATWREIPGEFPAAGSGECTGSGMPGSGVPGTGCWCYQVPGSSVRPELTPTGRSIFAPVPEIVPDCALIFPQGWAQIWAQFLCPFRIGPCKLLILWRAQKDSNLRPIDS